MERENVYGRVVVVKANVAAAAAVESAERIAEWVHAWEAKNHRSSNHGVLLS